MTGALRALPYVEFVAGEVERLLRSLVLADLVEQHGEWIAREVLASAP